MIFRKALFYFFFGLLFFSAHAQITQSAISKWATYDGFAGASIGLYAVDLSSRKILIDYQSDRLLIPASTAKLFSASFALKNLGSSYRPKTSLYYDGSIEDGILQGDIWIVGQGDMSLGSKYFQSVENRAADYRQEFLFDWVSELYKLGIRQINGTIYADGSAFGYEGAPSDWQWGDLGNYYGAHFSGIMLYDNILEYHFKTQQADQPADLLYTFPVVDSLDFHSEVFASTNQGDNTYIFGSPYSFYREARGTLPQHSSDFMVKGSLPDPEKQLLVDFQKILTQSGIEHRGELKTTREIPTSQPAQSWIKMSDYYGQSVQVLAQQTLYHSINVFAEGLMRLTALEKYKKTLHVQAATAMQTYWRDKLGTQGLFLQDGSGLSRTNSVSAKVVCELLTFMHADSLKNLLPVAGESGTMKNIAKNQAGHGKIYAKSGTLRRVKGYAGYAKSKNGTWIAFTFLVNNYTCSNKQATKQLEKLMNELVK